MKYLAARLSLLTLCTAALIGCKGVGDSAIPNLPAGTTCTVATAQSSITGTCVFPSPTPRASEIANASPTPRPSAPPPAPLPTATPLPAATPTATPTPTPAPLTGIWQWKGLAVNQGSAQMQGSLPYVSLLNALSGTVQITTNAFATNVLISQNTCPPSFNIQPASGGSIALSVNNSVAACSFAATDPATGSMVVVNYTNTTH